MSAVRASCRARSQASVTCAPAAGPETPTGRMTGAGRVCAFFGSWPLAGVSTIVTDLILAVRLIASTSS